MCLCELYETVGSEVKVGIFEGMGVLVTVFTP